MKIIQQPVLNFENVEIEVQYLIIHYTVLDLEKTLNRFNHSKTKVSSHFVIDIDGTIYECVPAYSLQQASQQPKKAWHCGQSQYQGKENLNNFSLGVEMINANGNFFKFTKRQYQSLIFLSQKLIEVYPNLKHPKNIIGHEQIAGHRGKIDPGFYFDWFFYLSSLFSHLDSSELKMICEQRSSLNLEELNKYKKVFNCDKNLNIKSPFWEYFSNWLEYSQTRKLNN